MAALPIANIPKSVMVAVDCAWGRTVNIDYDKHTRVLSVWDDEKDTERHVSIAGHHIELAFGLTSLGTFWYVDSDGYIHVHDVNTGAFQQKKKLPQCYVVTTKKGTRKVSPSYRDLIVVPALDGQIIYLFTRQELERCELIEYDLQSLSVLRRVNLPGGVVRKQDIVDREDDVLFWMVQYVEDYSEIGMFRFSKSSGEAQFSRFWQGSRDEAGLINSPAIPHSPSPNGEYWIRADNLLPVRTFDDQQYFGVSIQIWRAFPIAFEKRLVLVWQGKDDLPYVEGVKSEELFNAISTALENEVESPLDLFPSHKIAADFAETQPGFSEYDEAHKGRVVANWSEIIERCWPGRSIDKNFAHKWEADSSALWVKTRRGICRIGLNGDNSGPISNRPDGGSLSSVDDSNLHLLGNQSARVQFYAPAIENRPAFRADGAPSETPWRLKLVSEKVDVERGQKSTRADQIIKNAEATAIERATIKIPLKSRNTRDCIEAIRHLTSQIAPDWEDRSLSRELKISFELKPTLFRPHSVWTEKEFFQHVAKGGSEFVPALTSLFEAYCRDIETSLYSDNEEREGLLAYAALALATLSPTSYPILERYGALFCDGNEFVFGEQTAKRILTDKEYDTDLHKFALRFMDKDHCDSADGWIAWTEYGVREAARKSYTPDEYAALVRSVASEITNDYWKSVTFGLLIMEKIGEDYENNPSLGAWEKAMFRALELSAELRGLEQLNKDARNVFVGQERA